MNAKNKIKSEMKRTVKFLDAENKLVSVSIKVETKHNQIKKDWDTLQETIGPYSVLSITGERDGSSGQIDFVPANEPQEQLKRLWDTYHLNDLKAGTKQQTEILKTLVATDFNIRLKFLQDNSLQPDRSYSYCSAWLLMPLPTDIEEQISSIVKSIEYEYAEKLKGLDSVLEKNLGKLSEYETDNISGEDAIMLSNILGEYWQRKLALGEFLELQFSEIEHLIVADDAGEDFNYAGIDYIVVTDGEAEERAKEYLRDSGFWEEAVKAGNTDLGKDDWVELVLSTDGRASVLKGFDGKEDTQEIDGDTFYIYRI